MAECPICGLGERCRNHWVAQQTPAGEVEFQIGAMTASEDNLILLRNKLQNPPLRTLFEKIALTPEWVDEQGRLLAYLHWPLELRGAVNRALFPNGAPGADNSPLPPPKLVEQKLAEIRLGAIALDFEHCLPDEFIYDASFELDLVDIGTVIFHYMQLVWADGVVWGEVLGRPERQHQAEALVRLLLGGIMDPIRGSFAAQTVQVMLDSQDSEMKAGAAVDEIVLPQTPERHLGEEIEAQVNERRLQPLLRDNLMLISFAPASVQ